MSLILISHCSEFRKHYNIFSCGYLRHLVLMYCNITTFLICLKLSELINIIFSMRLIFILQKHLCLTRGINENVPAYYREISLRKLFDDAAPDLSMANIEFLVGTLFINIYRPDYICGVHFIFRTHVVSLYL